MTCNRCRTAISKVLKREQNCPVLFDIPEINVQLTPKMIRQIYVALLRYKLQTEHKMASEGYYDRVLAEFLGHGINDIYTIQSYKD